MMKNRTVYIAVLLGIAVGALAVLTFDTYKSRKAMFKTEYKDWRKLNLVLQQLEKNYVDSIDRKSLTDAAIVAALAQLDPHSAYLPPLELEQSEESLAGGFDGIGIQFNVPNDTAVVIEVIPGGPAEKIGMLPGDRIVKVDDKLIAGVKCPQDSMVRRMKGPAGTKVKVQVKRSGEQIDFDITRGKIPTWSVDASFMADASTGYLHLSKFSRTTYKECVEAISSLKEQGMKHLVFDLRDNSGGYFDQALMLSNLFLEKDSLIVYLEGLHRPREDYRADGRGAFKDLPLSVLINEGSASSSEIFAGAMQDNSRAQIVGRRSFGKGLVQEPVNFSDGSGLRITVARFHTPSGRCIQKPYTQDYNYEVLKRYSNAEMTDVDSMRTSKGGILPDVFVPIDTTRASDFYIKCNRKACAMRFASDYFDKHKEQLGSIANYSDLLAYLDAAELDKAFFAYVKKHDSLVPEPGEWENSKDYMLTQIRALVGRYSKLGDNAFYHIYLDIDDCFKAAQKL